MILVFEWLWKTGKLSVNRANTGSQLRCIALFSNGRTRILYPSCLQRASCRRRGCGSREQPKKTQDPPSNPSQNTLRASAREGERRD